MRGVLRILGWATVTTRSQASRRPDQTDYESIDAIAHDGGSSVFISGMRAEAPATGLLSVRLR